MAPQPYRPARKDVTMAERPAPNRLGRPATPTAGGKVPAVSRATAILRLLGGSGTPLGVNAIAREVGLVPSNCLYILRALAADEFVSFDPHTKHYTLGIGVLTLGQQWLMRDRFNDVARPILEQIAHEFDVAVIGLQVLGRDDIVLVMVSQTESIFQLNAHLGSRLPAIYGATGRCIAAFGDYSEAELAERFATINWDEPIDFQTWREQVRETRIRGFGIDEGYHKAGATFIAAPVWDAQGGLSHSIVATGITRALKRKGASKLAKAMLNAASRLTIQLGGKMPW